jgi:hypothetical protein
MAKVGEYTNYGRVKDEPNLCVLSNKTSPLDQPETIAYKGRLEKVSVTSLANPPKTRDGVYYGVTVRDIRREMREDGSVIDHPIDVMISFKHDTSLNWPDADVLDVLGRSLGALYDETSSSWRFKDMQRLALAPTQD